MRHRLHVVGLLGIVAFLAIGQSDCDPEWPLPPFDATGTYLGTWSGTTNEPAEKAQIVLACPLTMWLEQDTTLDYPADHHVTGTVEIDYSCIVLPEWIDEIPPNTIEVSGLLSDEGQLTLLSGGCTTALCLVLVISGEGIDVDADGAMDDYSGDWAFTILLAGVEPFGVTGSFQVSSVD